MTANNIPFQEVDVARDEVGRKEMSVKTKGGMAVPVVDVDGEVTVGYNEGWLKSKLGLK